MKWSFLFFLSNGAVACPFGYWGLDWWTYSISFYVSIWETNKISKISNSQLGSPRGFDSIGLRCMWIYKLEFEVLGWCRDNAQSRWTNQWYIRPRKLLFINILFYSTTTWCSQYTGSWYAWVTTGSYLCTQELWRGPTIYKVLFLLCHSYSNTLLSLPTLIFIYYLYMLNCSEYRNSQEGSELQPFTPSWNQNFIMWFKDKVHDNVFVLKTEVV